jgi:RNA polymerase sigma factor (sigma-70 family)
MDRERPVFPGLDFTPEDLERQGRALRGLARSLLGDGHAAEDVVQETWLACLRRPDSVPVRVSAWLSTITTRLARKHARGEGRRRAREERAGLERRLEQSRASLARQNHEREDALRVVTQALLELEEPFKGALLQRYFEERSPAEIAALTGVPLATVKSRLARGLEKLRARLAAERGAEGRARLLLALASVKPLVAGAGVGGAGVLGSGALAAGLLVAGGLFWLWTRVAEAPEPRLASRSAASAPAAVLSALEPAREAPPEPGAEDDQREALVPTAVESDEPQSAATLAPEARFAYRVAGRVRDENDLPKPGARVFLGPRGLPLNRAAETDDQGRFQVELEGRRPTLALVFAAECDGVATGLHELELVAGSALEVDVALCNPDALRQRTPGLADVAFAMPELAALERAPELLPGPRGRSLFAAPADCGGCERPRPALEEWQRSLLVRNLALNLQVQAVDFQAIDFSAWQVSASNDQLALRIGLERFLRLQAQMPELPPPVTGIHGHVRDERGEPVVGACVSWSAPEGAVSSGLTSDEHGDFALADLPPGEVIVRAGGGDHGVAEARFTLREGEDLSWEPMLVRAPEIRGRLVDSEGTRLPGWRVELWSQSSARLWSDATLTDGEGNFALPNVAPGALELHLTAPDASLPARVLRPVQGGQDLGVIELAPAELATGAFALQATDARGTSLGGAELRLWSLAAGRGVFAGEPDAEGRWSLAGLSFGAYRGELESPLGSRALGTLWLRPGKADEPVDLGQERLAPLGRLQLDLAEGLGSSDELERVRVSLWRATADVFALALSWDEAASLLVLLPPGDYVLCAARPLRSRAGSTRAEAPFTVRPGETMALTLELAGEELSFRPGGTELARVRANEAELVELESAACSACHGGAPR